MSDVTIAESQSVPERRQPVEMLNETSSRACGQRCAQQLASGHPCGGFAITDSAFCFAHTPGLDQERADARRRGGQSGRGATIPESDIRLRSYADLVLLIEATINDVRAGRLDPRVANCIGVLANVGRAAIERSEIVERLDAMEAVLQSQRREAVERRKRSRQ